jgi:hypothetical protein
MTDATSTALIVGGFAFATQIMSRLWSRVEHEKTTEITKKIEANTNASAAALTTRNNELTAKVIELSALAAKLEAEVKSKDLMAATLVSPPEKVVVVEKPLAVEKPAITEKPSLPSEKPK